MRERCHGLDVFRGFVILGVVFSRLMPVAGLPGWVYGARQGFGAVDLLFPAVLFCLGASIPLALSRRLPEGLPETIEESNQHIGRWISAYGHVLLRSALVLGLAYVLPNVSGPVMSLVYFFALGLIFVRLREKFEAQSLVLNCLGVAAVVIGLLTQGYSKPPDRYLVILGFNALAGAVTYMVARNSQHFRLVMTLIWGLIWIVGQQAGWVHQMLEWRVFGGLQPLALLKFQLIVLPGVAIGEALLLARSESPSPDRWPQLINSLFGVVGVGLSLWAASSGEFEYALILCSLLAANAIWFAQPWPLIRATQAWGWGLVLVGFLMSPLGGVRPAAVSLGYLLIATGVIVLLFAFVWAVALFARTGRVSVSEGSLRELVLNRVEFGVQPGPRQGFVALVGQNPLLAYLALS
ncbi:MAG: DUF5009 domain-containing protein [Fimbriimonadaceae bacterium]